MPFSNYICIIIECAAKLPAGGTPAAPLASRNFIIVKDCNMAGLTVIVEFSLGINDTLYTAKPGQVSSGYIVNIDNIRLGNIGEAGDLSAVVSTHLDNGIAVFQ